jgi:hypothetical protein
MSGQGGWGQGAPGWSGGGEPAGGGGFGGPPGGYTGPAPGVPFDAGPPVAGPPGAWGPWDAVVFAWERIKADPATVLGALVVGMLVSNAVSFVGQAVTSIDQKDLTLQIIGGVLSLANAVVATFMTGGMTMFAIKVARGDPYQFGDIFKGGRFFWSILGAELLIGLGVFFGILLLIVPGILLGLAWAIAIPLVVDREMGAIDAMKESWRLMQGHKGGMFLFWLLMIPLTILGVLACCVGTFVTGVIAQVGFAYIYLCITGQPTAAGGARG